MTADNSASPELPRVVGWAGEIDGIACRGARAMLGMSQTKLCEAAFVGRTLLNDFEIGSRVPRVGNLLRIRSALEAAGADFVQFDDGSVAVRVIRPRPVGLALESETKV